MWWWLLAVPMLYVLPALHVYVTVVRKVPKLTPKGHLYVMWYALGWGIIFFKEPK